MVRKPKMEQPLSPLERLPGPPATPGLMMNQKQLEQLALRGRWQDNRAYRGKSLCQECLLKKVPLSTLEDHLRFVRLWHRWEDRLKPDHCAVCGELQETIMLPAQ